MIDVFCYAKGPGNGRSRKENRKDYRKITKTEGHIMKERRKDRKRGRNR
jgi:hypothetical protein